MNAQRVAWILTNGPIATGMCVCHVCDNPPCVNPAHLFLGTQRDNLNDMRRKQRGYLGYAIEPPLGEKNNRAKLTSDDVREIRKSYVEGQSLRALGRRFGIAHTAVASVVHRRIWKHIN